MGIKVKAIVIGASDYKEKDKRITLFTLEKGKMYATLRSVKAPKAKLKFAKELFCFGDFFIDTPSMIVTGVDVENNMFELTKDIDKYYIACAILEVVNTIALVNEQNAPLFVETLKALGKIAYDDVNEKYVLIKYLLSVFSSMGYSLALSNCSVCGERLSGKRYLNLDFGEIVCLACKAYNSIEVSARAGSAMKLLNSTDYDKLSTLKLSKGSEDEVLNILNINFDRRFNKKLKLL